jgi:hypothetical protein
MLDYLVSRASDRKLRLATCGECRLEGGDLLRPVARHTLDVAERFADGSAGDGERDAAYQAAHADSHVGRGGAGPRGPADWSLLASTAAHTQAGYWAECMLGTMYAFVTTHPVITSLLRCVFGNPFRPTPPIDPGWLGWNGGTVRKLAEAIYDGRAFDRLPVLADALEDAGCTDPELLGHLRGPGPHARGCWSVDLLLGKE